VQASWTKCAGSAGEGIRLQKNAPYARIFFNNLQGQGYPHFITNSMAKRGTPLPTTAQHVSEAAAPRVLSFLPRAYDFLWTP
jgi:hypothetical protein